ncbi:hypothetical protein CBM2634_A160165 [Cupriavidus taiwanensis]|uniref:Uncharacterized protein n=1 Tax=Cupriavidus taiwanensis TaxID=164546 RepID=A0A375IXE2_9BURK|nr:hypothetical protein CBM2634_A160165 [Cupriavidus taiwanensis]
MPSRPRRCRWRKCWRTEPAGLAACVPGAIRMPLTLRNDPLGTLTTMDSRQALPGAAAMPRSGGSPPCPDP